MKIRTSTPHPAAIHATALEPLRAGRTGCGLYPPWYPPAMSIHLSALGNEAA
jgi:hypothetical protein